MIMPTRSVFWSYLGLYTLTLAAVVLIPETVTDPDHAISVRPRLGVPPGMLAVLTGACLGVFAAFSILGFFSSWYRSSCAASWASATSPRPARPPALSSSPQRSARRSRPACQAAAA